MNGQIFREEDELFTETSWAAVMMGQGISMTGHNPMANVIGKPETVKEINEMEQSIRYLVQQMPTHDAYLKQYCPAPA